MNFYGWRFARDSESDVPVDKCRAKNGPDSCSVHGPMLRDQDNADRLEKGAPTSTEVDSGELFVNGVKVKSTGFYYDGDRRSLAHGVKDGDKASIEEAARRLARLVPRDAVLIPVPSHTGQATYTLEMARRVADINGSSVVDALVGKPREKLYDVKKQGSVHVDGKEFLGLSMKDSANIPSNRPVFFVDNVVDSGITAKACHDIVGRGGVLAIAYSGEQALDAVYMDAVKRGDMETAARMVSKAAHRAMPNTKVVDEDGSPKTVYHGSESTFNVFDKNRIGENTDSGLWGRGFYFSSNEEEAKTYDRRNGTARAFYLDIENPCPNEEIKRIASDAAKKAENKYTDEMSPSEMKHIFDSLYHKGVEKLMKKNRYDGVIPGGRFNKEHVAIEPTQIKSADPITYDDDGNVIPLSKRFQMDNPDIRY